MITSDLFNNKLFENAEFGTYYCEQLAKKVFEENPELNSSGSASEVLNAAYTIARNDLGDLRARALFTYDEDFPGDLVTAYAYLQKQGVAEGTLNEFAPGGEGGNGPFDYGSAIVKIGEDFIDHHQDSASGEDAADIIEVGRTFMSDGMPAGIAALFALDTQVYSHVLEQLEDEGFKIKRHDHD